MRGLDHRELLAAGALAAFCARLAQAEPSRVPAAVARARDLRADGDPGAAALWSGGTNAVQAAAGARKRPRVFVLERPARKAAAT